MPKPRGKMPGKLGPVLTPGPVPESELQLGPGWALEPGQGSGSVSVLKLGPGVKQMTMPEPKSACELGPGPSEKLEPEALLEPKTASVLDLVLVLVPKTVSGLELVPRMMLESMTMSELERAPGGSPCPKKASEMEKSHQEWMLKPGLGPASA